MSNSSLASKSILSPNYNKRTEKICKITPHHAAGVLTAESLAKIFSSKSRGASSNYVIGNDGKIILVVEESNRAWTSSSAWNDQRAITIEVSNSKTGGNWPISDAAYNSLINLCVDICKRNGIDKLEFTGDKNGSLTMHKMFKATACPGPYLESKMPEIASKVNAILHPPVTKLTAQQLAENIKAGKYGNGAARKKALKELGYTDAEIKAAQDIVNGNTPKPAATPAKKSNEEIAQEVLAGKWGNGAERKKRLADAGYDYNAVQAIVNSGKKSTASYSTYVVKRGDTLSGIAARYGTTVRKIALDNGIANPNKIYLGQRLKIYR